MLELEDPDDRPNLYTVLELDDTATSADIKRAFNRLSRLYHPDRNREADAPQQFGAVHHAYSILHDDRARKVYDSMKRCEVKLEDMHFNETESAFTCPCRCGSVYRVTEDQLADGYDCVSCETCSLVVRVIYEIVEEGADEED